jgi:hypothetical protein
MRSVFVCFDFVWIFLFSHLGEMRLPWEWSWALRLSAAPVLAPMELMQMVFWRTNFEDGKCPSPGAFCRPGPLLQ